MSFSFSQSADSILNETFEDRKDSLDSINERPVWSDHDILSVNTTKTNVDVLDGTIGRQHAHVRKKRARLLSKKLEQDSGVSSASLNFLAGQAAMGGGGESSRQLPLPPVPAAHRVPVMGIGALAVPTTTGAGDPASLPLLHRIVKTINLWYHDDIDRAAAMGLLMSAEMGCFILRNSSRERTLALTVRNARPHECDHYLIFLRSKGLQIEGSFLTFQSIPKLIEYYCVHLRELPYLLKLPDIITNCACDRDLEEFNSMGTDFWSKYYPFYGSNQFRRHHHQQQQQAPVAQPPKDPSFLTSRDETRANCWALTGGVADQGFVPPSHASGPSGHDPCLRLSGTSSVDNLSVRMPFDAVGGGSSFQRSDHRQFAAQHHHQQQQQQQYPVPTFSSSDFPSSGRHPSGGGVPSVRSDLTCVSSGCKTRSVDSLTSQQRQYPRHHHQPSAAAAGSGVCQMATGGADPSSYRSSLRLRVGNSGQRRSTPSDANEPPSYDVMWEASEGRRLPLADPSPPFHQPPPPPPHAVDLKQVPGFPQPDRFRPKFTFEEFRPPPGPSMSSTAKSSSVIYDDPIDLVVPPAPPPRRHLPAPRPGRPPLAGGVLPVDLRTACSDDSLNRRVEGAMRDMNQSIDAMEADIRPKGDSGRPPQPPGGQQRLPPRRPVSGVISARTSTLSEGNTEATKGGDLQLRSRRLSQYDNVSTGGSNPSLKSLQANSHHSVASSRGTVFSNPWDTQSSMWHQLLQPTSRDSDNIEVLKAMAGGRSSEEFSSSEGEEEEEDDEETPTEVVRRASRRLDDERTPVPPGATPNELGPDDILHTAEETADAGHDMVKRAQARISEFVQGSNGRNVGAALDGWLTDLTVDPCLMFGQKLTSFIECTRDASERNPHIVMRNIRQFMDGIKHYLVQRDETGFSKMIENERKKLASDEFLNVERRLESALYKLVLKPLKTHIDNLMVDWHHQLGNLRRVRDNIRLASKHTAERLGIRNGLQPPSEEDLTRIQQYFKKMEAVYSPLEKLECLLDAVEIMYSNAPDADCASQMLSADDLMPVFTYVLVRCEVVSAELEAEYMQGLLASKFLLGEGAYYLSTLQAAVTVIKNFHRRPSVGNMTSSYEDLSQLHGVLRVNVLNERTDSTNMKTFPARPTMTARDLSILVAHRCHIFNPQDFSLYHFKDGKETLLKDLDLPYKIKVDCEMMTEKPCHFLYRRTNAVFALPLSLSCGR